MKISIITVSYNSASTITKTIESILSQSHTDLEYIIVDGASKDGTIDIIKKYEPLFNGRMRWISEPDKGIYDAMNKGLRMVTGDIVGILNSDDYYPSAQVLKRVGDEFKNTSCDAVFSDLQFVSGDNEKMIRFWKGSPYRPGAFVKGWHPAHPTFFVKKQVYEKFGLFDTQFNVSADFELMLRFIEKGKIQTSYIPETLIYMRHGGESNGSLSNIWAGNKNIQRAFEKNSIKINFWIYFTNRMIQKLKQFNYLSRK